jgi:hypothetical protein
MVGLDGPRRGCGRKQERFFPERTFVIVVAGGMFPLRRSQLSPAAVGGGVLPECILVAEMRP